MKAIVLHHAQEALKVREHPDPQCADDGAIIKVGACGICRSDWHTWHGGWAWEGMTPGYPLVMGHEFAGTVVEIGSNVRDIKVGDRVTAPFHFSCGRCVNCHSGLSNMCVAGLYPGSDVNGGFAEYVHITAADFNCIQLPDSLDFDAAASLGCRFMTAWRAVSVIGGGRAGEVGAVFGCGGLGLSMIQIGTALGMNMIAVDLSDDALQLAEKAGATTLLNPREVDAALAIEEQTSGGAHVSFDAVGVSSASIASVRSLRPRGRHVQVGLTSGSDAGSIAWPADRIVFRELQLLGSIGNNLPDYAPMMRLIHAGKLSPGDLVGTRYTLEEVASIIPRLDSATLTGLAVASM